MTNLDTTPPKLDRPGAGLPWMEALVGRYVMMRFQAPKVAWDNSVDRFVKEGERILKALAPFDLKNAEHVRLLETPVLINRLTGIEDSSRYWSAVMTMEHLITVGQGIAHIIRELAQHRSPGIVVDIAQVKPSKKLTAADAPQAFRSFLAETAQAVSDPSLNRRSPERHKHPWFGGITAHQWNFLLAIHQSVHRKQIEEILRLCRKDGSPS